MADTSILGEVNKYITERKATAVSPSQLQDALDTFVQKAPTEANQIQSLFNSSFPSYTFTPFTTAPIEPLKNISTPAPVPTQPTPGQTRVTGGRTEVWGTLPEFPGAYGWIPSGSQGTAPIPPVPPTTPPPTYGTTAPTPTPTPTTPTTPPTPAVPTTLTSGFQNVYGRAPNANEFFYDSSTGKTYMFNGSTWVLPGTATPPAGGGTPTPTQAPTQTTTSYTVLAGDTLSGIAAKLGVPIGNITGYKSGNPNLIYPGEVLTISGGKSATTGQPGATSGGQTGAGTTTTGATTQTGAPPANATNQQMADWLTKEWARTGTEFQPDVIAALLGTGQTEEEVRKDIYLKYGIDVAEKDWRANPAKSYEEIYAQVLNTLGFAAVEAEVHSLEAKIKAANDAYAKATGDINENPWISEAGRVGKIEKLTINLNNTLKGLTDALTVKANERDRIRDDAKYAATTTLSQYNQERQFQYEELQQLEKRAEADIAARLATEKTEATQESLRYYSDYMKNLKTTSATYEAPKTMETTQGIMEWDAVNGKWVNTGLSPYVAPKTGTGKTEEEEAEEITANFRKALTSPSREDMGKKWFRENFIETLKTQFPQINPQTVADAVMGLYTDQFLGNIK